MILYLTSDREIVYPDIRALNDIFDTFTDAAGDAGIVHRIQMDPFRSARK